MSKYYYEKRYLSSWEDHEEMYNSNLERIIDRQIQGIINGRSQSDGTNKSNKSSEGIINKGDIDKTG